MTRFHDRREAGRLLGRLLAERGYGDVLVLGLPRGGVPVAYEVAEALRAPLDVFIVRKLGLPLHEEVAMGAIASGGVRVMVPDVIARHGVTPADLEAVTAAERVELARRERAYRGDVPFPRLEGRTVIVVDDGVATGASMRAACEALRALGASCIVAAAPVMSPEARAELRAVADACETVSAPERFHGVGLHYRDFTQTDDAEVIALLDAARRTRAARPASGAGR